MIDWSQAPAPSLDDFANLAQAAFDALPQPFRGLAGEALIRIEDFAEESVLAEMEIEDPFELTGLYDGIPLTEKSVMDQPAHPDVIWLFRRPILEEWIERGDVGLGDLITHVLVHELAHHFGWSDADIASVDPWWE